MDDLKSIIGKVATGATLSRDEAAIAFDAMTQGLLLFDASQRLVICNQRYIEMYGLSAETVKPGCSFHDIIAHRKATGSFAGEVDQYVARVLRDVNVRNSMSAPSVSSPHSWRPPHR